MPDSTTFETTNLVDAAFLKSLGHRIQSARPSGELVVMGFDLTAEAAQALLSRPEHGACARFKRALRDVRRLIDIARYQQGQLP
jgi:hypothetical protein